MTVAEANNLIDAVACPDCYLCGSPGRYLYRKLEDRLFGAPGEWHLKKCVEPRCGLIWPDPMPTEESIGKAYEVYYTHSDGHVSATRARLFYNALRDGYLQAHLGYRAGVGPSWYRYLAPLAYVHPGGTAEMAASTMFLAAPRRGASLLEVGCGSGQALLRMRELGWQVQGVDNDPRAVEAARAVGVPVCEGDLESQHFPAESFDAIYTGHVIEHVHDPSGLLKECYRVLKRDGTLVLLTPNAASWGHKRFGQDWRGLEQPRHLHIFNPDNMQRLLRDAGYTRVSVSTLARGARTILSVSDLLRHARESGAMVSGLNSRTRKLKGIYLQVVERLLLVADHNAGEELLGRARKPGGKAAVQWRQDSQ